MLWITQRCGVGRRKCQHDCLFTFHSALIVGMGWLCRGPSGGQRAGIESWRCDVQCCHCCVCVWVAFVWAVARAVAGLSVVVDAAELG